MKNNKYLNTMLASAVAASMIPATANAAGETFKDIGDSYAKGSIQYLVDKGIIAGYADGKFNPKAEMTRQEFASLLARTLGIKGTAADAGKFEDVSSWAKNDVGALAKKGIVAGYSEKKFGAQDFVTREQMAVFFVRALGYETEAYKLNLTPQFDDADQISDYAKPAVAFANALGFVQGDGKNFNPKQNAQRQAVAALAERLHKDDAKAYKEKAEQLVKDGMPAGEEKEITITTPEVTNVKEYVVKGVVKDPGEKVVVSVESKVDKTISPVTTTVVSNDKGEFEATLDLSTLPDGELVVKAGYQDKDGDVEKTITKKVATVEIPGEVKPEDGEKPIEEVKPEDGEKPIEEVKQVAAKIKTETIAYQHQVGEKAVVKYQVLDKDGKPVADTKVRVQAYKEGFIDVMNEDRVIVEEKELVTDKDGYVTFEYRSYDVRKDYISAIVLDKPLVRSEGDVSIQWNVAITGLVNVDQVIDIELGAKTEREYNLAFVDEAGIPLPEGTRVYVKLGEFADLGGATSVVVKDAKKNKDGEPEVEVSTDGTVASFLLGNTEGKAKVQIRHDIAEETIKPTFYYHKDIEKDLGKNYTIAKSDPRVQAGAIHFVKQQAKFSLSEEKITVAVEGEKELNVTVKDQFGKDYKGEINIGIEQIIDNLNATNSGAIQYALDLDRDGKFDVMYTAGEYKPVHWDGNAKDYQPGSDIVPNGNVDTKSGTTTIPLDALLKEEVIKAAQFNVTILGGEDKDEGTFVVFADDDKKPGYTAGDTKAKTEIKFVDDILGGVNLKPLGSTTISRGQDGQPAHADFEVSFVDVDGKAISLEDIPSSKIPNIAFQVLNSEGKPVKDLKEGIDFELEFVEDVESFRQELVQPDADLLEVTNDKHPETVSYTKTGVGENTYEVGEKVGQVIEKEKTFIVRFKGLTNGDYTLRVFADEPVKNATGNTEPNATLQDDEVFAEAKITVKSPEITKGELIDEVFGAAVQSLSSYSLDNAAEVFTYILKDQNNVAFKAEKDEKVVYSFKNSGKTEVKIHDFNATDKEGNPVLLGTIPAGGTYSFEKVIIKGSQYFTFQLTPGTLKTGEELNVNIEAQVKGNDGTKATDSMKWIKVDQNRKLNELGRKDQLLQFNGEVVGFSKVENAEWFILKTAVGNVLFDLDKADVQATYIIDGNTVTSSDPKDKIKIFYGHLSEGDTVEFANEQVGGKETDDAADDVYGKEKFTLTNKK